MRRGIDNSTALSTHLQLSSILSEGVRMSRKCLRLHKFIYTFGDFIIEFIDQHNTNKHRRQLLSRFHRAISRAAADHFHKWGLSGSQLWCKITEWIRRTIPTKPISLRNRNLIRSTINLRYTNSKRKRERPQNPSIIADIPLQNANSKPSKHRRPNPKLPDAIPNTPIQNPNSKPSRSKRSDLQLPTIIPNDEAACESEDLDSKMSELPSPTHTPQ